MKQERTYLRMIGTAVIAGAMLMLVAVTSWQESKGAVQAQGNAPLLSSSIDIWQAGGLYLSREVGLFPDATDMTTARIAINESAPLTYTVIGIVHTAPLTATVTEARLLLDRSPSASPNPNTLLWLAVCEGTKILRVISSAPLDVGVAPESTWLNIPLVQSPKDLTIEPAQYLCYTGRKTSEGWIDVYMSIQAAVRYWAPPTDFLYLSTIQQ